jgi:hypothetical protein
MTPAPPDFTVQSLPRSESRRLTGQTRDEDGIPYVAQSQQLGHEVPGMRGIYSHVTDRMLDEIREALQRRWLAALRARAALSRTSAVPALNGALTALSGPRQPPPLGGFAPTSPPKSDI